MNKAKPFDISKRLVYKSYLQIRKNKGGSGIDMYTFEKSLSRSLYRLCNRMSSGSYFPKPVQLVEIPKSHGSGTRPLGIPTIEDRIAQMTVVVAIIPIIYPVFHNNSYGDYPCRSAHNAVLKTRQMCFKTP
jgi:retron-type reverse transcriptase